MWCCLGVLSLGFPSCADKGMGEITDPVYRPEEGEAGSDDEQNLPYRTVEARTNSTSTNWITYTAKTVARLEGFEPSEAPEEGTYGGWKEEQYEATGFFYTKKIGDRWWLIDPEGYPYIHRGMAVFNAGSSGRQQTALREQFGSTAEWARQASNMLKAYGFNGVGAWSNVDQMKALTKPMAYCVIVSPMGEYNGYLKAQGEDFSDATWEGYQHGIARVWDAQFDKYVDNVISSISQYRSDKWLLGYFVDNELPWRNDALDRCFKFPKNSETYKAAENWLKERKGKNSVTISDATDNDRKAFTGYYFETFISKVSAAVRKYDPNHLFLGSKFNQEKHELINSEIMELCGKYQDIISVDHYRMWEPSQTMVRNWVDWSGIPYMIVEFYTKGEDSGLPNQSGAGWNVKTQADRGYFYQNFVIELLRSKGCVGWHWFKYQDNDPEDLSTDESNRDSNKGVVTWDFQPYTDLLDEMKEVNDNTWQLIQYFDK